MWPLLELLAKITWALALLVLAKFLQLLAFSFKGARLFEISLVLLCSYFFI